ncbi:2-dehydro-3-deoxyphosphogluconate aldolase/(4S)-4-hydroxy-2-oxoglutarate aldolase [Lewinella marina]|uniref:2-dehydro-3-deoxyphosphogluconate aldolase n=1 Tax=Neolewinella marina TaxID=438751 RepID=A0A2G0CDL0_9BACT|nr:bifunctional 4-hydroxy-2-oxoglutarate aldolase/2-dehydro-3-deoxy-phosphogluconate aldolase [Neolewinella marina]NJB85958.1 2-dehydro-3-deoxyphosphogluconate aldolase/(4S)-4-hydroxy-2-oxoglutarate aldolase [Neolewinella marina]PHK98071.1 2-dehydro-3-deoxyphosphogluconate aldolase [Neolewinella marina]
MSTDNTIFWKRFHAAPVVGIARGYATDTVLRIGEAYAAAGLTTLEITINSPDPTASIARLREQQPTLNVGAGTVCTEADLDRALDAGAMFIVTPVLAEAVISRCVAAGVPVFPGAYTPTEIYRAWTLGAPAVKVFPAGQLGVQYLKDVLGPLNEVKLLPTGGVDLGNIQSFLAAGAVGVGMGSSLLDKALIAAGDFRGLEAHFSSVRAKSAYTLVG